ncbi:MAG: HNH endonuclease [Candidatus Coproplasma sp.]
MNQNALMEINRETAMSLWNKRYGKATRVEDFAGREMDKGAYGNRDSKFGWNLDHILPKSQGGKDTESNLICCHIKTNDEKADKFPVFVANGKTFEIIKVENHYEIREKSPQQKKTEEEKGVNFFDHSAGIAYFNECKKKNFFIGVIKIILNSVKEVAILDFIREVLSDYKVSIKKDNYSNKNFVITVNIFDVSTKDFTQRILNDCVLLNTYLNYFFLAKGYIGSYSIINSLYCYDYRFDECDFVEPKISFNYLRNGLIINELVRINTNAEKEELSKYYTDYSNEKNSYWEYNYFYTKLANNLKNAK